MSLHRVTSAKSGGESFAIEREQKKRGGRKVFKNTRFLEWDWITMLRYFQAWAPLTAFFNLCKNVFFISILICYQVGEQDWEKIKFLILCGERIYKREKHESEWD